MDFISFALLEALFKCHIVGCIWDFEKGESGWVKRKGEIVLLELAF